MNDVDCVVRIRLAAEGDVDGIVGVLRQAFAEVRHLYTPAAYNATTPGTEIVFPRMGGGPIWVAIKQDEIVGTIAMESRSPGCYLRSMGVLPNSRSQGVGWRLLATAEQLAIENGSGRPWLRTTPFLANAIHLYSKFGFQRSAGEVEDLFGTLHEG